MILILSDSCFKRSFKLLSQIVASYHCCINLFKTIHTLNFAKPLVCVFFPGKGIIIPHLHRMRLFFRWFFERSHGSCCRRTRNSRVMRYGPRRCLRRTDKQPPKIQLSHEKNLGWLFDIGDENLHSYMGIIINQNFRIPKKNNNQPV